MDAIFMLIQIVMQIFIVTGQHLTFETTNRRQWIYFVFHFQEIMIICNANFGKTKYHIPCGLLSDVYLFKFREWYRIKQWFNNFILLIPKLSDTTSLAKEPVK